MQDIKLNIQLFAETETPAETPAPSTSDTQSTDVNTALLEEAVKSITSISESCINSFKTIFETVNDLYTNGGLNTEGGASLAEIITDVQSHFGGFESSMAALGTFLASVIEVFVSSDKQITDEITAWGTSISSLLGTLGKAATGSGVNKGDYTSKQFATDIKDYGLKMSELTRQGATETVGMISKGMDYVKSSTGYSVLDWGGAITNEAVGTAKTLFGFAGENPGASIVTNLANALKDGFGTYLGK